MIEQNRISTGLEFVPKFDVTRRLKGGWFCGPEEYESMGFTLGMPPCLYLPETQESNELIEKIKPMNGMIMPSFYTNQNFGQKPNKNIILVSNISLDVKEEDITKELNRLLIEAQIFPPSNRETNPSFTISCQIIRQHFVAYVKMVSAYVAEKAVNLQQLLIKDQILPISFPDFILKDLAPLDKIYAAVKESQLCIVLEIDYNSINPKNYNNFQLPSKEKISEYFGKYFTVNRVHQPFDCNHVLLYLNSLHDVDMVLLYHQNCIIDDVPIIAHRSSRDPNESECYTDPILQSKLHDEIGVSQYLTVLSPFINQPNSKPSVADIFDNSIQLNTIIRKETEELQESSGLNLLIFNIIQQSVLSNQTLIDEIKNNIKIECNNYGKVSSIKIGNIFKTQLPFDSPVACVTFETTECAKAAQIGISGRRFRGRIVITQIVDKYPEFFD